MSTVTSKGQVTIPKEIRERLKIEPGSVVDFEPTEDGRVVLVNKGSKARGRRVLTSRFAALRGAATVKMSTRQIMALTRGDD